LFFEGAEEEEFSGGAVVGDGVVDEGLDAGVDGRGDLVGEGVEFGFEEAGGDEGDELGEEAVEGDEDGEGVGGAGLDGLGGEAKLKGEVGGLFDGAEGEVFEVGWGEGVGVAAVLEGVEIARGSASAARAELGIAVGAAEGVAVHGPVGAAGVCAVGFVGVSWHFANSGFTNLRMDE
jgi:hypothetical protein